MHTKLAYKVNELAGQNTISRTKLFQAIRNGELRARKVGRATIVLHDDFIAYLNGLPIKTSREV